VLKPGSIGRTTQNRRELSTRAWRAFTSAVYDAVLNTYAFDRFGKIVDVGGGDGTFMLLILSRHQSAAGIVFDLPHVVEGARERILASGLSSRCELSGGTFFESVPESGDAYILSRVLHDWKDDDALVILRKCREAMSESSTLLLVEQVLPERPYETPDARTALVSDLRMMVMNGGQERNEAEFRELLGRAGFQLIGTISTRSLASIVEAIPV
jgi:hypothetical protein